MKYIERIPKINAVIISALRITQNSSQYFIFYNAI
jgi:hypothetical protein